MKNFISTLGTRICLGGEGMGLYQGKAITIPITSLKTSVSIEKNDNGISIKNSPTQKLPQEIEAIIRTFNKYNYYPNNILIDIKSNIPTGFGLASSATFYMAICKAINGYFMYKINKPKLIKIAYEAEYLDQGVLVGLTDTYAVTNRKILFQDHSYEPSLLEEIDLFPEDTSIIIAGSYPTTYEKTGIDLKNKFLVKDQGVLRYQKNIKKLIPLLKEAWIEKNKNKISHTIRLLFKTVIDDLGIKNNDYLEMTKCAIKAGAYCAKNIGLREKGGSIYALCLNTKVEKVVRKLKNYCSFIHVISEKDIG